MKRSIGIVVTGTLMLTACAMPEYAPSHDQNVEQAAADRLYCKAVAEGVTPQQGGGFVYAQGSPQFVGTTMGAYAVAGLIGAAIRQQHKLENYDDCMVARGYHKQQVATQTQQPTAAMVGNQLQIPSQPVAATDRAPGM